MKYQEKEVVSKQASLPILIFSSLSSYGRAFKSLKTSNVLTLDISILITKLHKRNLSRDIKFIKWKQRPPLQKTI